MITTSLSLLKDEDEDEDMNSTFVLFNCKKQSAMSQMSMPDCEVCQAGKEYVSRSSICTGQGDANVQHARESATLDANI